MSEDIVLSLGRDAIWTTVILAAPLLVSALIVGLIVSIVQAVTQINEATLTFIPKMLAIVIVMIASFVMAAIVGLPTMGRAATAVALLLLCRVVMALLTL